MYAQIIGDTSIELAGNDIVSGDVGTNYRFGGRTAWALRPYMSGICERRPKSRSRLGH